MRKHVVLGVALATLLSSGLAQAGIAKTSAERQAHRALARGPAAVRALVKKERAHGRAHAAAVGVGQAFLAAAQASPQAAAELIQGGDVVGSYSTAGPLGPVIPDSPVAAIARVRAHAAGCWGSRSASWTWHEALTGADVGRITKIQNGFCGNGSSITSDSGWGHSTWAWGPYCIGNFTTLASWDVYPSWKHGGVWGNVGVNYAFGCGSLSSGGHAVIRIAANGHTDNYDDYGF